MWACLSFPIIISLFVEIIDNLTKHLAYFQLCDNMFQRVELREARIKQENLYFSQTCLNYKLSENKTLVDFRDFFRARLSFGEKVYITPSTIQDGLLQPMNYKTRYFIP